MGILSVSNYSILPSIAGGLGVSFTKLLSVHFCIYSPKNPVIIFKYTFSFSILPAIICLKEHLQSYLTEREGYYL